MAKYMTSMLKVGLLAVALLALAACGSSRGSGDGVRGGDGGGRGDGGIVTDPRSGSGTGTGGRGDDGGFVVDPFDGGTLETVFYFDFDVAEFRTADREALVRHARALAAEPALRVRLEGHADERGTREYNLALGERRANGIFNFLIVNGAARSQLEVISYGEERPARTGSSEAAFAANRRVEIVRQ